MTKPKPNWWFIAGWIFYLGIIFPFILMKFWMTYQHFREVFKP